MAQVASSRIGMNELPQLESRNGGPNVRNGVLLLASDGVSQLLSAVLPAIGEEVVNASVLPIGIFAGESLSMPDEVKYQHVAAVLNGTAIRGTAM